MAHLKFLCHQFILPYLLFSLHSTTSPTYQLLTPLSITYSTFLSFHQFNLFSLSYVVFYFLHNLTPVSLVIRTPPTPIYLLLLYFSLSLCVCNTEAGPFIFHFSFQSPLSSYSRLRFPIRKST